VAYMKADKIRNVVVVGSGTMEVGIAQTFAQAGIEVALFGRSEGSLEKVGQRIRDNLDLFVEMEILKKEEGDKVLELIHPTVDMESACRAAQYLTEAVPEVMKVKQHVFKQADRWCPDSTILASCTSTFSIDEIGSVTRRRDRVVGTHWIKPAQIIQLVEIVLGPNTSNETLLITKDLLKRIGKVTASCKENPGHMHNAMQYALSKVALNLFERGIANAEDIDTVAKHGFGLRMTCVGTVERLNLGSLQGFKRNWESINSKTGDLGSFPGFLQRMIDQGRTGLKEYSKDEVRLHTKERDRELIRNLRALGRIK